jgi:hypothetical protein
MPNLPDNFREELENLVFSPRNPYLSLDNLLVPFLALFERYGAACAAQEREDRYSPWLHLDDIPPGSLFETEQGTRAIKSEYRYPDGAPECVLLASGEYAHFADKGATLVRVIGFAPSAPD